MYTVMLFNIIFIKKMPDMFRTNLWFIFRGLLFSNYISYTFMVHIKIQIEINVVNCSILKNCVVF
jgi:hypothetical protein